MESVTLIVSIALIFILPVQVNLRLKKSKRSAYINIISGSVRRGHKVQSSTRNKKGLYRL